MVKSLAELTVPVITRLSKVKSSPLMVLVVPVKVNVPLVATPFTTAACTKVPAPVVARLPATVILAAFPNTARYS